MKKFTDLLKNAQSFQEKLKSMQTELNQTTVSGEAGAGLVKVDIYVGKHDVKAFHFDDSLLQEPKNVLEDLAAAAVNDALRKAERILQEKMSGLSSDTPFNLDGFMKGDQDPD